MLSLEQLHKVWFSCTIENTVVQEDIAILSLYTQNKFNCLWGLAYSLIALDLWLSSFCDQPKKLLSGVLWALELYGYTSTNYKYLLVTVICFVWERKKWSTFCTIYYLMITVLINMIRWCFLNVEQLHFFVYIFVLLLD